MFAVFLLRKLRSGFTLVVKAVLGLPMDVARQRACRFVQNMRVLNQIKRNVFLTMKGKFVGRDAVQVTVHSLANFINVFEIYSK